MTLTELRPQRDRAAKGTMVRRSRRSRGRLDQSPIAIESNLPYNRGEKSHKKRILVGLMRVKQGNVGPETVYL